MDEQHVRSSGFRLAGAVEDLAGLNHQGSNALDLDGLDTDCNTLSPANEALRAYTRFRPVITRNLRCRTRFAFRNKPIQSAYDMARGMARRPQLSCEASASPSPSRCHCYCIPLP
eukprot:6186196-Pleurochrysis_carterae.AAC.3